MKKATHVVAVMQSYHDFGLWAKLDNGLQALIPAKESHKMPAFEYHASRTWFGGNFVPTSVCRAVDIYLGLAA